MNVVKLFAGIIIGLALAVTVPVWAITVNGVTGGGTVNSGTTPRMSYYASTGTALSDTTALTYDTSSNGINFNSSAQVNGKNAGGFSGRLDVRDSGNTTFAILGTAGLDLQNGATRIGTYAQSGGNMVLSTTDGSADISVDSSGGGGRNRFAGGHADTNYSYQTPATGFTITLSGVLWHTILDPAGTLATGTITMPASPINGQIVNVRSSQVITSLTVSPNSGQSILGAPASFAVGGIFECMYRTTNTTWYC